jgi:hypothetical protein
MTDETDRTVPTETTERAGATPQWLDANSVGIEDRPRRRRPDLSKLLDRRRVLMMLGELGAAGALAACTPSTSSRTGASSTTPSSSPSIPLSGTGETPVPNGSLPSAPQTVTSITADASATVSWYAPAGVGSTRITHYIITPHVGGSAQTSRTIAVGDLTMLTDSYGGTALQADVTGLRNSTAYTFTVTARNANGDGPQSTASGENTPLPGLVFGDDFNGPAGAAPDPEWWVYERCGYLAQNEVQGYAQTHCVLDGNGNLKITAEHADWTGDRYPSDPSYPGTITQPWTSGACQSNTRLYHPSQGNTMTFESRFQVNSHAGDGYWPGFFWLEGQEYLQQWKTDPRQDGWNDTTRAEIDIAEWSQTGQPRYYGNVSWAGTSEVHSVDAAMDLSAAMHTFTVQWKPNVSVDFFRDGSLTFSSSSQIPSSGAQFFLLLYLQMLSGGPTGTESAYVDYVRVYDQDLG